MNNATYLVFDPCDGWRECIDARDALASFDTIEGYHRDESVDGIHEDVEQAGLFVAIPVAALTIVKTADAEDDTEDSRRCREAGWDFLADIARAEMGAAEAIQALTDAIAALRRAAVGSDDE